MKLACKFCDGRGRNAWWQKGLGLVESPVNCSPCRGTGEENPEPAPRSGKRSFGPKQKKPKKEELSEADMQKAIAKYMRENNLIRA